MFRGLLVILLVGGLSFHYAELGSASALRSVILPIAVLLSLIALALWLVLFFHRYGINQRTGSGDGGFGDGGCSGGDGGGD
jgi:hypothetical protein